MVPLLYFRKREASMNTKRNILPMLLAALLLFCLPMASLAEDVPIQNVSIRLSRGRFCWKRPGRCRRRVNGAI